MILKGVLTEISYIRVGLPKLPVSGLSFNLKIAHNIWRKALIR